MFQIEKRLTVYVSNANTFLMFAAKIVSSTAKTPGIVLALEQARATPEEKFQKLFQE